MPRLMSFNQLQKYKNSFDGTLQEGAFQKVSESLRALGSPLHHGERIDHLINIHFQTKDQNKPPFSELHEATIDCLNIIFNAKSTEDLARCISERILIRDYDSTYVPNQSIDREITKDTNRKSFMREKMQRLFIKLGKGELSLEGSAIRFYDLIHETYKKDGMAGVEREIASRAKEPINEKYFGNIEREEFRAIPAHGIINKITLKGQGDNTEFTLEPFNTKMDDKFWKQETIYAIGTDGDMFIYPNTRNGFNPYEHSTYHSSAFSGKAVLGAGVIKTDKNGMINYIDNHSGHYQPSARNFLLTLKFLKNKDAIYQATQALYFEYPQFTRLNTKNLDVSAYNIKSAQDIVSEIFNKHDRGKETMKGLFSSQSITETCKKFTKPEHLITYLSIELLHGDAKKDPQTFNAVSSSLVKLLNLTSYEFCSWSKLPGQMPQNAEAGKIYIGNDGNYCVYHPSGIVNEGVLPSKFNVDPKNLNTLLNNEAFKADVLKVTSRKGHTAPIDCRDMSNPNELKAIVLDRLIKVEGKDFISAVSDLADYKIQKSKILSTPKSAAVFVRHVIKRDNNFHKKLDLVSDVVHSLIEKKEVVKKYPDEFYMDITKSRVGEILKNHPNTVGVLNLLQDTNKQDTKIAKPSAK